MSSDAPRSIVRPAPPLALMAWSVTAAFGAYFCMYAFRKPFTAPKSYHLDLWGIDYKTLLVTAQVGGYMLSKFIGIPVIAQMPPHRRATAFVLLIVIAWVALLAFALVPPPYNLGCLFLNGLSLGMVFGLVVGFLEGRRVTEVLTAGLCASFIVADGFVKSVGAYLLQWGVPLYWMPFAAGGVFLLPQMFFVWMLTRIPPPTSDDIAHRSERVVMTRLDMTGLLWRYGLGLSLLVGVYLLVTILRSIRADFAPEIWAGLGITQTPGVFTSSEMVVALGIVVINGSVVLVNDNRTAFFTSVTTSLGGLALVVVALIGLASGWVGAFAFMVLIGLGLYVPYVAVHTTLFERLLALLRERGNLGYLMYLADSFGYLGYVAVMLVRNFVPGRLLWHGAEAVPKSTAFLDFFLTACWISGVGALVLLALAGVYFAVRARSAQVAPCSTPVSHAYYHPEADGRIQAPSPIQGNTP